ncbi:uncharacterized protein N7483_004886 [Penicillium malachiteum]|uniref:uncharacterized protein n=1 Tax=Penicillium malachiteum TaxID=1324776 RepID=UPI0025497973|nr:uncharacterized protein N7483_004886 [Penicillium malachiteum]KAJ5730378.1 hypothetical protein N7483_004886 [Penicillium malachiteum]
MAPPIPIDQKLALQQWANSRVPKPSLTECRIWFADTFKRQIPQSTTASILKQDILSHLTHKKGSRIQKQTVPRDTRGPRDPRSQESNWPLLDLALFEWQQRLQSHYNFPVSGDMLRKQGQAIWNDQKAPSFSRGWLDRFQKRYDHRSVIKHGLIVSIPTDADYQMEHVWLMEYVHLIAKQYDSAVLAGLERLPITLQQGLKLGGGFLTFHGISEIY